MVVIIGPVPVGDAARRVGGAPAARVGPDEVVVGGRRLPVALARALSSQRAGVVAARRGVVFLVGVASPTDATSLHDL